MQAVRICFSRRTCLKKRLSTGQWSRILSASCSTSTTASDALLEYNKIKYNSVEIDVSNVENGSDVNIFETKLRKTIKHLCDEKHHAVYLSVPMSKSSLIEPAGRLGFRYHHAEDNMAKLYMWMANFENKIPAFATHSCGVGGVVMLEGTNKVLAIREQPPHNKNWKLPGGYANLGEDFCEAAIREVWEETGINCTFVSILAFRHSHAQQFGRSNLYVICLLEAKQKDLSDIALDTAEIEEAKWMELEEYKEKTTHHPMSQQIVDILISRRRGGSESSGDFRNSDIKGLKEKTISSVLSGPNPYKFYHV